MQLAHLSRISVLQIVSCHSLMKYKPEACDALRGVQMIIAYCTWIGELTAVKFRAVRVTLAGGWRW